MILQLTVTPKRCQGQPSLYVPFSGGKTSTLFITSFTNFAFFGNRGKDSNTALQQGQCQR
jgi:hypothetical protein